MDQKTDLLIKGLRQRITELVSEYEEKLIKFRVEATIELQQANNEKKQLQEQINMLEEELQPYRNQEMEVSDEKL